MYSWVVVELEQAGLLPAALARAWQGGGAEAAHVDLPARKEPRVLVFTSADPAGGTPAARRPPRWPDLLTDWSDIYSEPLFPDDAMPVLAEEISAMGADALLVHAAPGVAGATVAWYERGALSRYEHVGGATVSWAEGEGLGRPSEGGGRGMAVAGARKLAGAVGTDRDEFILDRIEQSARATGEALIERALYRFLAADPPPFDELAGLIARAAPRRLDARR
jgi:hypothetical protein